MIAGTTEGRKSEMNSLRDTVFGDLNLTDWLAYPATHAAAVAFGEVKELAAADDPGLSGALSQIAGDQTLETRHRLEAHHIARIFGQPLKDARYEAWGVVVEASVHGGLDTLAAYQDYFAHYYNFAGGSVVWENPDQSLHPLIDDVIDAARSALPRIGLWEGPRRTTLEQGWGRLNILTPQGLCFGEAPLQTLDQDIIARPLLHAATRLMKELTAMASSERNARKS